MPGSAIAGASAVGDTAATGTATTVALSDHRHSREAFGTPVVVNGQTTSLATGSLTTLARADHVHTLSNVPTLLASANITANTATYTFSSIPSTFTHLQLVSVQRSSGAYTEQWGSAVFNADTGSNYLNQSNGATTYIANGVIMSNTNGLATSGGGAVLLILNYTSTTFFKTTLLSYGNNSGTGINLGSWSCPSGYWKSLSAITSITLTCTAGDSFVNGSTFRLYGLP
jgi:hypothetical protein